MRAAVIRWREASTGVDRRGQLDQRATSAIVTAQYPSSAALRFHLYAVAGGHGSSGHEALRGARPGAERVAGVLGSSGRRERNRHALGQRRRAL
jgi:hypothetical protein